MDYYKINKTTVKRFTYNSSFFENVTHKGINVAFIRDYFNSFGVLVHINGNWIMYGGLNVFLIFFGQQKNSNAGKNNRYAATATWVTLDVSS